MFTFKTLTGNLLTAIAVALILISSAAQISCTTKNTPPDTVNPGASVPGPSAEEEGGASTSPQQSSFAGQLVQVPLVPTAEPVQNWSPDGIISPDEYTDSAKFGDVTLYWRTYYEYFYAAFRVPADGWVALGIQPQSGTGFENADVILGFVSNGKTYVYDMFSTGPNGPFVKDTDLGGASNIFDYGSKQEGGYTVIEFKRALSTGDKYDLSVSFPSVNMILAYGSGNQVPDSASIQKAKQTPGQMPIFYYAPPEYVC